MSIKRLLGFIKTIIFGFLRCVVIIYRKMSDYTGPLAGIIKGFLVAVIALAVFSPFIVYSAILSLAQSIRPPLSYVLYVLWLLYFGSCVAIGSMAGYLMETKSSSWLGPKSLDYHRLKSKKLMVEQTEDKQEADLDKSVQEYLQILKKQRKKK